jgi:hypothetical protein
VAHFKSDTPHLGIISQDELIDLCMPINAVIIVKFKECDGSVCMSN